MAKSLASLVKVRQDKPPRLLIYGPEKMGKTSLAAQFPDAVFIQTEQGESEDMVLDSFGEIAGYADVIDALEALYNEDHEFGTVVVDSVSALERLIWAETCRRNNWASIEQPGYGKGYVETDYVWKEVVDRLNALRDDRAMAVVLIGHAVVERFDDPETQSYSRYEIDLHKRALALLKRDVDAILLIKKDVSIKTEGPKGTGRARANGGDSRWIYCEGRPAFTAGNRYGMPEKVLYKKGEGFAAISPFFPQPPAATLVAQAA